MKKKTEEEQEIKSIEEHKYLEPERKVFDKEEREVSEKFLKISNKKKNQRRKKNKRKDFFKELFQKLRK